MLDLPKNMSVSNVVHFRGIPEGYFVYKLLLFLLTRILMPHKIGFPHTRVIASTGVKTLCEQSLYYKSLGIPPKCPAK